MIGRRPPLRLVGPRPTGQVIIEYQAGFGNHPEDLRHALPDQIAAYYDTRGAVDQEAAPLPPPRLQTR